MNDWTTLTDSAISSILEQFGEKTFYTDESGEKYFNVKALNSISKSATIVAAITGNNDSQYLKVISLLVGLGHAAEGRTMEEVERSLAAARSNGNTD